MSPVTPSREAMKLCTQCGRASQMDIDFCPHCGRIFDAPKTDMAPLQTPNHYQNPPGEPAQTAYSPPAAPPWSERTAEGKSLETAFCLALIFGFLGVMGLGHLYMKRVARGLVFLVVGGSFALWSLASWIVALGMTEYSIGARVFAALLLSIPYLLLQAIQVMDVRKPPKGGNTNY